LTNVAARPRGLVDFIPLYSYGAQALFLRYTADPPTPFPDHALFSLPQHFQFTLPSKQVSLGRTEDMEQQQVPALPKLVGRVEVCNVVTLKQKAKERSAAYKAQDNKIGVHQVSDKWEKPGEDAMARFKLLSPWPLGAQRFVN
jgi:hypothetical protein